MTQTGELSYCQRGMWFLHHADPDRAAYNVAMAWRLGAEPDVRALAAAVEALGRRHPQLRTVFPAHDGVPVQRVGAGAGPRFAVVRAGALRDADLDRQLVAASRCPFDLATGPVLRFVLYDRGAGRWILLVVVHHIVMDAWSLFQCLDELGVLYAAARTGAPAALPDVGATYLDHVRRERALLDGPEGERLAAYWRRRLAGPLPPLDLPTDRPRPAVQSYRGDRHGFVLGPELTAALTALSRAERVTLFGVLLTVFQILLFRYSGQPDVRVAVPLAHRDDPAYRRVVGYFADSVVVRTDLSGDPPVRQVLRDVRGALLDALRHQDLPFARLVEVLRVARTPDRPPVCEVACGMQTPSGCEFPTYGTLRPAPDAAACGLGIPAAGGTGLALDLGGLLLESYPLTQPLSRYDLDLQLLAAHGDVAAALTYNTDLFDRATAERLAGCWRTLLTQVAADPGRRLSELTLLSDAERADVLRLGWG